MNWPLTNATGAGKLSRASIVNTLQGDIEGEGVLEYLLSYPSEAGAAVEFIGYERLVGSVQGRVGSVVLEHRGTFSPVDGVRGTLVAAARQRHRGMGRAERRGHHPRQGRRARRRIPAASWPRGLTARLPAITHKKCL